MERNGLTREGRGGDGRGMCVFLQVLLDMSPLK